MNRHVRPFGLKLGPLQAGAVYFPVHFMAVGAGLTLLAQNEVSVFWPATGTLFAFLLLYPGRYWPAVLGLGFLAEILSNEVFAPPQLEYTLSGLLYFMKFAATVLGVWLMHVSIRGPISFARLHHVLAFSAAAAVSTLATAFVAVSLRSGHVAANLDFWLSVQNWWIGDFLGALIVTPLLLTIGFHGIAVTTRCAADAPRPTPRSEYCCCCSGRCSCARSTRRLRCSMFRTSSTRCWYGSPCSAGHAARHSPPA